MEVKRSEDEINKLGRRGFGKIKYKRIHNTMIEFAKIFQVFPICFMEVFDYRLRMYNNKDLFSITTGIKTYYLVEFSIKFKKTYYYVSLI